MPIARTAAAIALCLFAVLARAGDDPFTGNMPPSLTSDSGSTQFLPVEQAYRIAVQPGNKVIHVRWTMAKGYYLYHHGFKVWRGDRDITAGVKLPQGMHKTDPYFGRVEVYYGSVSYDVPVSDGAKSVVLTLQSQGCADAGLCYPPYRKRFEVDLDDHIVTEMPVGNDAGGTVAAIPSTDIGLALALVLAFAGGIILNLMPCVLPVLALKALAFAETGDHRVRHRHGWVYTAGVIATFLAVAAVLVGLRAAGESIGWGFQLQSPWFVGGLVYLFVALSLALAGVHDIGASFMGVGEDLTRRPGYLGTFFTGVLATLVASPCTAPFMGTALGYAAVQPAATALSVFAALGFGMAFPYLLLGYLPRLVRWLPHPGPWMVRLREFMAFPLLATAVWLMWVLTRQTGATGTAIVLSGSLVVALALWLPGSGWTTRMVRIGLLVGALALLHLPTISAGQGPARTAASNGFSEPFTPQRLQQLRDQGRAVFVNFTADWCITCLANEATVLGRDRVHEAFRRHDVTYLKADWTHYDPMISKTLAHYGRSGIPLYLYFPPRPDAKPVILPQVLTTDRVLSIVGNDARVE